LVHATIRYHVEFVVEHDIGSRRKRHTVAGLYSWQAWCRQPRDRRAGKEALFGYFAGQMMRVAQDKANPTQVNELLKKKLSA